jgi:hypothetical protein
MGFRVVQIQRARYCDSERRLQGWPGEGVSLLPSNGGPSGKYWEARSCRSSSASVMAWLSPRGNL